MDNSLRNALIQMVELQSQSLNALYQINNSVTSTSQAHSLPNPSTFTDYANYAGDLNYGPAAQPTGAAQPMSDVYKAYADILSPQNIQRDMKTALYQDALGRMSPQQQQMMAANYGGNVANSMIAGTGAVAQGVVGFGSMAMGGALLPSIVAGTVGGAVVGGLAGIALDQGKQASSYNKYLLQESYRFINPFESNNDRGTAGFNQSERWDATSFLRHADSELRITDDEVMTLLEGFTESGLMKGTSDLKSFEEKYTKLTEYVKQASITLNASFEETTALMGELEKRGILSEDFDYYSAMGKTVGSILGVSATEGVGAMTDIGTSLTTGTNMDTANVTENTGFWLALTSDAYDNAKANQDTSQEADEFYNLVTNVGGREAATQRVADMAIGTLTKDEYAAWTYAAGINEQGEFDADLVAKNIEGKSAEELSQMVQNVVGQIGELNLLTGMNNVDYYASLMSADDTLAAASSYNKAVMESSNVQSAFPNATAMDVWTQIQGYSREDAMLFEGVYNQHLANPDMIGEMEQVIQNEQIVSARTSESEGLLTPVVDEWKDFKNNIGDASQAISEFTTGIAYELGVLATGRDYETMGQSNFSYSSENVRYLREQGEKLLSGFDDYDYLYTKNSWLGMYQGQTDENSISTIINRLEEDLASGALSEEKTTAVASALEHYQSVSSVYDTFGDAGGWLAENLGGDKYWNSEFAKDLTKMSQTDAEKVYREGMDYLEGEVAKVLSLGEDEKSKRADELVEDLKVSPEKAAALSEALKSGTISDAGDITEDLMTAISGTGTLTREQIEGVKEQMGSFSEAFGIYHSGVMTMINQLKKDTEEVQGQVLELGGTPSQSTSFFGLMGSAISNLTNR